MEGTVQVLRYLHWCQMLFTVTQCSFSFSSSLPWPEKSAKGDRQLFSGIWQSKNPSWLTVVHFTLCMSTHRRGEASKKSDGGCQCQQNSFLWYAVSKRWASVLLWTWRDVCYLGDGECVWLDLCRFSVHILTSLIQTNVLVFYCCSHQGRAQELIIMPKLYWNTEIWKGITSKLLKGKPTA